MELFQQHYIYLTILLCYIVKCTQGVYGDPCVNYTSLTNLTTRDPSYGLPKGSKALCDRYLDERWYRTEGRIMTTIKPTFWSCGTTFPIWLADSFPPNDGLEYERKACVYSFLGTCSSVIHIKIKNCVTFYVYYLVPTRSCDMAYCFSKDIAEKGALEQKGALNKYKEVNNVRPDPCNDITDLPRMQERKLTLLKNARKSNQICDKYLKEKWYKSDGSMIATSPRRLNSCGTKYPIWLADLLPENDGKEHSLKVCMKYRRNTCHKSWNIKVKNCGKFYLYSLNPTAICPSAYCFVPQGPTIKMPQRQIHTFSSMKIHRPDPCLNYRNLPKLQDRYLKGKQVSIKNPQLCDGYLKPAWYRHPKGDMVTSPPAVGNCGTTYPIWLQATLPPNDTREHKLTTCKVTADNECAMKQNIKVKNCGKFYVYFLIPSTSCPSAYCFEKRQKVKKIKNKVKTNRGQMINNSLYEFNDVKMKNDPCYNNVPLPNLKARRSCRHLRPNVTALCDLNLEARWYKVKGRAMSTEPPPVFKCGTQLPMWLADPLPPQDGIEHSLTACGVSFLGQCTRAAKIKVKNCGQYFVYYLVPTVRCPSAYCFASCTQWR